MTTKKQKWAPLWVVIGISILGAAVFALSWLTPVFDDYRPQITFIAAVLTLAGVSLLAAADADDVEDESARWLRLFGHGGTIVGAAGVLGYVLSAL